MHLSPPNTGAFGADHSISRAILNVCGLSQHGQSLPGLFVRLCTPLSSRNALLQSHLKTGPLLSQPDRSSTSRPRLVFCFCHSSAAKPIQIQHSVTSPRAPLCPKIATQTTASQRQSAAGAMFFAKPAYLALSARLRKRRCSSRRQTAHSP